MLTRFVIGFPIRSHVIRVTSKTYCLEDNEFLVGIMNLYDKCDK